MMRERAQNHSVNRLIWITAGLLLLCMAVLMPSGTAKAAGNTLNNPVTDKSGVTTWDCIWFGNYYQNSDTKKEPIKWRVLSVSSHDALLLADVNLDCRPYHDSYDFVTWEDSSLRAWLNKDFMNAAFSAQEKLAIVTVTNKTGISPYANITQSYGGNDTRDQIFCLSWEDLCNPAYGFPNNTGAAKARVVRNTPYSAKAGAIVGKAAGMEGASWFWLRTPGYYNKCASFMGADGSFPSFTGESGGVSVSAGYVGVRPAMHINLSRAVWTKAEQVTSEDTEPTYKSDEEEGSSGADTPSRDINKITPTDSVANAAKVDSSIPAVNVDEKVLTLSADLKKKTLNVKFKKVSRAVNYRIAYRKGGASKWSYAWSAGKNNYTISKLKENQLLEFRIAPFAKIDGVWKSGAWSKITYVWFTSTTATVKSITKGFSVKVKKNKSATGYQLLYGTDKKLAAALKKGKKKSLTAAQGGKEIKVRSLKKKTGYYVRWRPVKKYKGKTYLGIWNSSAKVKTK